MKWTIINARHKNEKKKEEEEEETEADGVKKHKWPPKQFMSCREMKIEWTLKFNKKKLIFQICPIRYSKEQEEKTNKCK